MEYTSKYKASKIDSILTEVESTIKPRLNSLEQEVDSATAELQNDINAVSKELSDTSNILAAQIASKQDAIADLESIRSGAEKGATAIQEVKTINGQSIEGVGNIIIESGISTGSTKKILSVLFVGNSLTQDGIAYLPYMLKNYYPEVDFRIYMWYIGGSTLGGHYSNFTSGGKAEIFSVAENNGSWTNYSKSKTMASILSTYTFDIVCMQEYFNYKEAYADATDWNNCRDYILANYKGGNALEFVSLFHAPLRKDGYDVDTVYERTAAGNALILQTTISEDMIPNGIAVYRALDTDLNNLGDLGQLSPDGTHTQEGLPCLLQTYVTLCWLFDRLSINKSVYGHPMRMTTAIYNSINVPGANLGKGVVQGTDAQNILAQEVAIKAYKEGKQFVMRNLYPYNWGSGAVATKCMFTITSNVSNAVIRINGIEQASIEVVSGSAVNWEVIAEGYYTQSGSEVVTADTEKHIELESIATLVSITAEFTQGEATIFNEQEVDDLKKYLVVTANYDDGTSGTTDDYTLSGELLGGESEIEVLFGGKATSFTANVTEVVIPSEYTRYDYIEKKTTGKNQVAPSNFIYLAAYEDYNQLSLQMNLAHRSDSSADESGTLGSRLASGSGINYYAVYWKSGSGEIKLRLRNMTCVYNVPTTQKFAKIIIDNPATSPLSIRVNDGEKKEFAWTDSVVVPHPMCLFNNIPDGSTSSYYINRDSQIGEMIFRKANGECVSFYVPTVYNGMIGMYEVLSKTFYTAKTTAAVTISNSSCYYAVGNW